MAADAPPTLAVAAALTDLRGGTWVYASPLRPAWSTVWEAHSLSAVIQGCFEMSVGTGTVTMLRKLDGPALHTPIELAGT
jgi:hypothetical protein